MEIVNKIEITAVTTPRPLEFKIRKHSIDDLMGIKLAPSKRIIRLIKDNPPEYIDPLSDTKLKESFIEYKIKSAENNLGPKLNNYFDRIRWSLHRFLLRHKVII